MIKLRRKSTRCYNCEQSLLNQENYCPECGQENHLKQVSTSLLLKDFFDTYLSFDSKLFLTLQPLLFKPGSITKDYLDGKRVKFVPPIRLFIFLSFLYFFISYITGEGSGIDVQMSGEEAPAGQEDFSELVDRNINALVLLFTPIHALILMLFFSSKDRKYYVNFFVFTLHIFSFLFVIGILLRLTVIPVMDWLSESELSELILWAVILIILVCVFVYSFLALKVVFERKYTFLRFVGTLLLSLIAFSATFLAYILVLFWFNTL